MIETDPVLIAAGAAFLALWFWLALCWRGESWLKTGVKTGSVALLAVAGWVGGAATPLIAALALGSVGDFFLSRPGQRAFLAGLVAFAAAHMAYVVWLWQPGSEIAPGAAVALVAFGGLMARILWLRAGAMRGAVMTYIVIIVAMGIAAFAVPGPAWTAVVLAALLFILSDTVLAAELFVLPGGHILRRVTPFVIWASYWLAQAGFLAIGLGAVGMPAL